MGLNIPGKVRLAKIDAEGHELPILVGMRNLLERDHPVLIVEDNSVEITSFLQALDYKHRRIDSSSNRIFE